MRFADNGKSSGINIIPLLDTIFILLIFFSVMLINAAVTEKLAVDVPSAESGAMLSGEERIVTVISEAAVELDGVAMTMEEFRLKKDWRGGDSYIIRADRKTEFGLVVMVLSALRERGVEDVGIEIQSP